MCTNLSHGLKSQEFNVYENQQIIILFYLILDKKTLNYEIGCVLRAELRRVCSSGSQYWCTLLFEKKSFYCVSMHYSVGFH
jgi:hypothetical protein